MRPAAPLAAVLAALTLPALAATASARTWSQQWTVGPHPVVRVETNDARVSIHRGHPGSVDARVEYTVNFWGFHTDVRDPRVELSREGDTIHVVARPRSVVVVFGGESTRFHIDVTVPPECNVQARSGDGSITVEPIEGALDVETGDGRITVHGARGDMRLWTGDGGIDADGLDGSLVARTGDGHLHVAGRFDRMDLRSGDGRVEASASAGSRMAGPWELSSGDGGITLRIPRELQAMLDVEAHDGGLHVELPIANHEEFKHHQMRGQLNGGTQPLRVRTGDGSITLALSN